MRVKALVSAFSICLVTVSCWLPRGLAAAPESSERGKKPKEPEKFALLVGINEYPMGALAGCENDVEDFEKVLLEKYKFPPAHIRKLISKEATRDNIIAAFKSQLIDNAKKYPDGIFVFEYSGHGSQTKDINGDEEDGIDETIVPVDSRQENKFDIVDDELNSLFAELTKYTPNMTFILDSCHSGTGTRGMSATSKARTLPPDDRVYPAAVAGSSRGSDRKVADKGSALLPRDKRYVTLSGCHPTETSQEDVFVTPTGERRNGLLTVALVDALRKAGPDITYRELWETVADAVTQKQPGQHPQIEGDLDRVFLGGAADRCDPFVKVKNVADKTVTIEAGKVQGVNPDAAIAFYRGSAMKLTGDKDLIAKGEVVRADDFSADVNIIGAANADELKSSKALVVTPFFGSRPLRVELDSSIGEGKGAVDYSALLRDLETDVKASKLLNYSGSAFKPLDTHDRTWDFAVVKTTQKDFLNLNGAAEAARVKADDSSVLYVADPEGKPVFGFSVPVDDVAAGAKILETLELKASQDNLRALRNAASPFSNKISYELIRLVPDPVHPEDVAAAKEQVWEEDQYGAPTVNPGERIKLQINNRSDLDLFVTCLSLGTSGKTNVIYPPAGGAHPIPAGGKVKTGELKVGGPLGLNTFKFIVTSQPVDFRFLEQTGTRGQRLQGIDSLRLLVAKGCSAETTRDVTPEDVPAMNFWTTGRMDMEIKAPDGQHLAEKAK
jgi:hypothetical protein